MAEHYRFFGGTQDDPRQYNQTEFAEVLERIFKNGIFPGVGSELKVEPTDPARMAVRVAPGQAWIKGYWYKNDDWKEIDLPPADPNYPRIHRIVLRLDTVNERKIIAIVKIGTPQAIPSVPELERNNQYWELSLATVYVAAGATSVTANDITDDRYTETCCGVAVPRDALTLKDATSAVTPNTIVQRDSAGRAQVATPSAANDAANKSYVDNAVANRARTDVRPTFTAGIQDGDANNDVSIIKSVQHHAHTRTVELTYSGGNLSTVTEKDGTNTVKTTTLNYDSNGRLSSVVEVAGGVTVTQTLNYDGNGNLTSVTRAVS